METFTDYYAVLGVDTHASSDAIKAAFKKLALKYHPDVYKGEDAEERMRLLLLAYQTLSDTDERRVYDMRHMEHLGPALNGSGAARQYTTAAPNASAARPAADRRFAFPKLDAAGASSVDFILEGYPYKLWPDDALLLKRHGMLRGSAPDAAQGTSRYCHRCHHRWTAPAQSGQHTTSCPNCKAVDWADYLLLHCAHCNAVFESQEIRDQMRGGRPYNPYELFPLCPSCRRSQWCAAENERVAVLRAAEARRRAIMLGGAFLVLLIIAAILFFVVAHQYQF